MTTTSAAPKLTRIAVFYDGNFFAHVSTYYRYGHEKAARITVSGLHTFIRHEVARLENTELGRARIVDAHYFRGRLSAHDVINPKRLFRDRVFDDVLMREGVTAHFLPITPRGEKGIDVWFAVEALDATMHKRFDVVVLVACDGDYVPLVRKISALGSRVMLLGWDFDYFDDESQSMRETRTSQALLEEVTYPLRMATVIEERSTNDDPVIDGMFMQPASRENQSGTGLFDQLTPTSMAAVARTVSERPAADGTVLTTSSDGSKDEQGTISTLREGYGFITRASGPDLYFYHEDLINCEFEDLSMGATLLFQEGQNPRGPCARMIRLVKR